MLFRSYTRVYGVYHGFCFSIYYFVAVEAFAKWNYPEEFQEVDPTATLKEYHERFMPIDYSGTFFLSHF